MKIYALLLALLVCYCSATTYETVSTHDVNDFTATCSETPPTEVDGGVNAHIIGCLVFTWFTTYKSGYYRWEDYAPTGCNVTDAYATFYVSSNAGGASSVQADIIETNWNESNFCNHAGICGCDNVDTLGGYSSQSISVSVGNTFDVDMTNVVKDNVASGAPVAVRLWRPGTCLYSDSYFRVHSNENTSNQPKLTVECA
jgi:hypothetical protein